MDCTSKMIPSCLMSKSVCRSKTILPASTEKRQPEDETEFCYLCSCLPSRYFTVALAAAFCYLSGEYVWLSVDGLCFTRPDSLPYKSEASVAAADKRSSTSARAASRTRDSSPALQQQNEISQSASSMESSSSLTV